MSNESEEQEFDVGERVLCYEPDKSKAKVLYDSKVVAVQKSTIGENTHYYEYKIHFVGWNSSWDQYVFASSLLKDNAENRELQRVLKEAADLEKSAGYTNRDKKGPTVSSGKKKSLIRGTQLPDEDPLAINEEVMPGYQPSTPHYKPHNKGSARKRDNSGNRKVHTDKPSVRITDINMRDPRIAKRASGEQEDRVELQISKVLLGLMEEDYNMLQKGFQHGFPSRMPLVKIFENFVKQQAFELAIGVKSRSAHMDREYDRVKSIVCMLQEVVDGLRIYFEFNLETLLLYKEEKEYVYSYLDDENLKKCCDALDKSDSLGTDPINKSNGENVNVIKENEHYDRQLQQCLRYMDKTSNNSKNSKKKLAYDRNSPYVKAYNMPEIMRELLMETFQWRLLSPDSPPEKSMIFGAPHLARLLIKMPECLNASPISDEKLKDLLVHLNSFINYLENHNEWFSEDNYVRLEEMIGQPE